MAGVELMAKKRRATVSLVRSPTIRVSADGMEHDQLVYAMVADRKQKYPGGRSRIVYIGRTEKGVKRLASSAAERAKPILALWGVGKFWVHVFTSPRRQRIQMRKELERALLKQFKIMYGEVPLLNKQGKNFDVGDPSNIPEFKRFAPTGLKKVLEELA